MQLDKKIIIKNMEPKERLENPTFTLNFQTNSKITIWTFSSLP